MDLFCDKLKAKMMKKLTKTKGKANILSLPYNTIFFCDFTFRVKCIRH